MQACNRCADPIALAHSTERGKRIHLVDVRTPAEYLEAHAAGAVSEPLDQLDAKRLTTRLGDRAGTHETLHLICASGRRAEQAAHKLRAQGLNNIKVVDGGTEAWAARMLPMERSAKKLTLERQTQIALGVLILLMLAKGTLLHPLFLALIGLMAIGLIVAGITARCGLAALLARMPWNRFELRNTSTA